MPAGASRITDRLHRALVELDDGNRSIADIARELGRLAEEIGVPRPSYERVRALVHEARSIRARSGPSTAGVLLDVGLRIRPPSHALDHMAGTLPRYDPW